MAGLIGNKLTSAFLRFRFAVLCYLYLFFPLVYFIMSLKLERNVNMATARVTRVSEFVELRTDLAVSSFLYRFVLIRTLSHTGSLFLPI